MPTLQDVFQNSKTKTRLSFSAAMVVIVSLYHRCFELHKASTRDYSYPFWDNYYQTDKMITQFRTDFLSLRDPNTGIRPYRECFSLILSANLASVAISLHRMAMDKAERDNLHGALAGEAMDRCLSASSDILETVKDCRRLEGKELHVFQQGIAFFTGALNTVIQAHLYMLTQGKSSASIHINALRSLSSAITDLINPGHLRPGLMEQIGTEIAKPERSVKRSRTDS
jgi:hypothetical protein